MTIKPSSASEIRSLTSALASEDEITRETAIARLAIFGPRAVDRVAAAYPEADRTTRSAILRVLEAIADPRGLPLARRALMEGGDVAVSATATVRALLDSPTDAATGAFDALVALAMDRTAERRVRLAALDALREMPEDVRTRVSDALREEDDPQIQIGLSQAPHGAAAADAVWRDATEGKLGDEPAHLRDALATRGATAALGVLQKMIDAVRAREAGLASATQQQAWISLRGALHQALALRGSNVAVYDLREAFESAAVPLPATFLTAVHVVGDLSCVAPLAVAYSANADERWRQQLTAAFGAIAARERITARSAALTRLGARWPDAAAAFSTTLRTRPRRTTPART